MRQFLGASLSRRFAVVLAGLLLPIVMVSLSIRQGLFSNANELIEALRVSALARKSLSRVLIQDDVTKELFLDPGAIELAERKISAYDENLVILAELRRLSDVPQLTALIDQMAELEGRLRPLDTEILETLLDGHVARARELYFGAYHEQRAEFEQLTVELGELAEKLAADAEARMLARNRQTVLEVAAALLVGMAVVALLVLGLSRRLGARTVTVLKSLQAVARGDLGSTPGDPSHDELGRIAAALDEAIARMRGTVLHVSDSLVRVGDGTSGIRVLAGGVSEAVEDQMAAIGEATRAMSRVDDEVEALAASADVLSASVGNSSSAVAQLQSGGEALRANGESLGLVVAGVGGAVHQMVESLDRVLHHTGSLSGVAESTSESSQRLASSFGSIQANAEETDRLSREVVSAVERGRSGVERTIEGMGAIRQATDDADDAIRVLIERAGEIDQIVDVITRVADETGLLALNAAILAAQAGEQGMGFGVVASQIKALATSVLAGTREVTQRVSAVQDQAARVAEAIERGQACVRGGVQVSQEAGQDFAEIQEAARESSGRMLQVVDAVRCESAAVDQMVEVARVLSRMVGDIRGALDEQRRGTGVLREATHDVERISGELRRQSEAHFLETRAIADSVEKVRESSEQIRAAVSDQRSACDSVGKALERVAVLGRHNEQSAGQVRDRLEALEREAEELGGRIRWFKA